MLSKYRVLDLSDDRGQLCGQLLAGLGAEVIAVEAPSTSAPNGVADQPEGEDRRQALMRAAMRRGKKSVALDLRSDAGREQVLDLVRGADILVESAGPGHLDDLGLGHRALRAVNPDLIHVAISAFGQDGPKAGWAATDLTLMASSGTMWLTGDAGLPPLRSVVEQSWGHAAAEAVGAALIAIYHRQHHGGAGQLIDVSAQQSASQGTQSMMLAYPLHATQQTRVAGGMKIGPLDIRFMWPCKDGHVSVTFLFGSTMGPFTRNLMEWVHEEGFCDEDTRDKDWIDYTNLLLSGQEPVSEFERVKDVVGGFFLTKTKAELLAGSFERRLLVVPLSTTREVLDNPHLAARGYWDEAPGDHGRTIKHPGAICRFSATPRPGLAAAVPVGQDTGSVLGGPARHPYVAFRGERPGERGDALAGLNVLDLSWVIAGPAATRVLADFGATVVHVESSRRMDAARGVQPFRDEVVEAETSGLYNNMNAGKLGLALDLSRPEAAEVVHDLVAWADVVVESFSPGAMGRWGLAYEDLRRIRPDVIMASSSLMGQTGPYAQLAGFGTMGAAFAGFSNVVGWPGRAPSGPFGAYTDYVSPKLLVASIMAALEYRRETGEGQYLDLSQVEASMPLLAPALLAEEIDGHTTVPAGNAHPVFAPHGVYPALGEEEWIAIAVVDDLRWQRLCDLLGDAELAGLDRDARRARAADLDGRIARWTAGRGLDELETVLQAQGIASHRVNDSAKSFADPQLRHRGQFAEVPHATQGSTWVEGARFVLDATPGGPKAGGPVYGEHSWEILGGLLGYSDERIAELAMEGLLE